MKTPTSGLISAVSLLSWAIKAHTSSTNFAIEGSARAGCHVCPMRFQRNRRLLNCLLPAFINRFRNTFPFCSLMCWIEWWALLRWEAFCELLSAFWPLTLKSVMVRNIFRRILKALTLCINSLIGRYMTFCFGGMRAIFRRASLWPSSPMLVGELRHSWKTKEG